MSGVVKYIFKVLLLFAIFSPVLYAQTPVKLSNNTQSVFLTHETLHFYEDKEGKLSFEEVQKKKFSPLKKAHNNISFSKSTYWVKFKLQNTAITQEQWFFELAYPVLDIVDFYYKKNNQWQTIATGDRRPFSNRPYNHRHFVFPLKLQDSTPHTYYIKVKSTSVLIINTSVFHPTSFHEKNSQDQIMLGALNGILLVMGLYNLLIFLIIKDRLFLVFGMMLLSALMTSACIEGQALKYLWPNGQAFNSEALGVFRGLFFVFLHWYTVVFLNTKVNAPFLHKLFLLSIVFYSFDAFISIFHVTLSSKLQLYTVILVPIISLASAVVGYRKGLKAIRFYTLAWLVFPIVLTLNDLALINLITVNSFFLFNIEKIAGIFIIILFALALADRYQQHKKEKDQAQADMLEMQRDINNKLEKKVEQRTGELLKSNDNLKRQSIELMALTEEVQEANAEVMAANENIKTINKQLEKQRDHVLSSINYAKRIQKAVLPFEERMQMAFPHHFILYRPKDVVSGDFYWFEQIGDKLFLAVGDCTGHGVPGALMTMLGSQALANIIIQKGQSDAGKILDNLDSMLQKILKSDRTMVKDGMDIVMLVIDNTTKQLQFAGARNPLIIVQNGELREVSGDIYSINGHRKNNLPIEFTTHTIDISEPTTCYMYSDGFQDQFGGERGKKFMKRRFKNLLHEISGRAMPNQYHVLSNALDVWMKSYDQMDDILVMGLKL